MHPKVASFLHRTRSAVPAVPAVPVGYVQTVTVPLTLPVELYAKILAMGEYDNRADLSATVVDSMDGEVTAWLESGDADNPPRFLKRWLKAHPPEQLTAAVDAPRRTRYTPPHCDPAVALVAEDAAVPAARENRKEVR